MDPWWNPATEDQAVDRIHRLGQKRAVEIIRYVAKNTVEGKIIELQNQKREMISVQIENPHEHATCAVGLLFHVLMCDIDGVIQIW
jgi:SNF2 family DNA or RNA helicase